MEKYIDFKKWLDKNTPYTEATKRDIISRLRRAEKICEINENPICLFYLSQNKAFMILNVSVKSQMKKAVRIYQQYIEEGNR